MTADALLLRNVRFPGGGGAAGGSTAGSPTASGQALHDVQLRDGRISAITPAGQGARLGGADSLRTDSPIRWTLPAAS